MAEWSKALRSGRSLHPGAWVRIPLLSNLLAAYGSVVKIVGWQTEGLMFEPQHLAYGEVEFGRVGTLSDKKFRAE